MRRPRQTDDALHGAIGINNAIGIVEAGHAAAAGAPWNLSDWPSLEILCLAADRLTKIDSDQN